MLLKFAVLAVLLASSSWADETLTKLELKFKAALRLNPDSFEANYNLGELYLHAGRLLDGIPYMEKAQALQPAHYTSGYDLALAYFETRNYLMARQHIRAMLSRADSAELHSLLADVEEAARATAIAGLVSSVCTTGVSREFLRRNCKRVGKAKVPSEWRRAIGI